MYILAGILVLGLICNILVRPVSEDKFMTPEQEAAHDAGGTQGGAAPAGVATDGAPSPSWVVAGAWIAVGVPIAIGVWVTLKQAAKLFGLA
jgi:hypothetical protein